MPNFKVHVVSGILIFPLTIPLLSLIQISFGLAQISDKILVLSFLFFTLGSDAPDLDHKGAYMHRVAKVIVWMLATVYLFFLFREKIPLWVPDLEFLRNEIFIFYIAIILGLLFSNFLSAVTPAHRGPFHSFIAPIVFGLIIGALFYFLEIKNGNSREAISNSIYIGISSLLGYTLHLIMDYTQTYIKKKATS